MIVTQRIYLGGVSLNRQKFLELLTALFDELSRILPAYVHSEAFAEIVALLDRSGEEDDFLCALESYFRLIASTFPQSFDFLLSRRIEKLKGTANLYSMRFSLRNKNIRILFAFHEENVLLLCAFHERSGKAVSSYEAFIPLAEERLNNMIQRED